MSEIRTDRHCVFALHCHLVFVTKYRHRVVGAEHIDRLEQIMAAVCVDFECDLVVFNGETNHVPLLVDFPPRVAISRLVNSLKGCRPDGPAKSAPLWPGTTAKADVVGVVFRGLRRRRSRRHPPPVHRSPSPAL